MKDVAVQCDSLIKTYGGKRALNGFTLSLPANRVTAVLGPNGAGKSTFFRMLTGLTAPDSGSVRVLGHAPGWRTNRQIAYLPDRARWYGNQTVAEALDWGAKLLPGFDRPRAEQLLRYMDLELQMPAEGMSRGQEARLMLTLCIARDVPLLVLDEPFAGIDLISRERIVSALIDNMSDREQTVLISTHEIVETEGLFDYAVFLENGRVALAGETEELRRERGSLEMLYRKLFG
ncbi:ABC transporter [Paenibacillus sp. J31TS4]|uniref:ABC transporter ATP-binding protein n=1 Tax=Paenibacillus sp. J31TS4 TaxID=2807195 RepID=UPI001B22D4E6|nr:ABC transporter ATP-binding protein [Paenibacillus sp. J31TS4]GIP37000.1 ABC transporter [Paenibacillus sp. J31TS4]